MANKQSYIFFILALFGMMNDFCHAGLDKAGTEIVLGEKNVESYAERYQPKIFQDPYKGKVTFLDDVFFQNYFQPYLFQHESDYTFFLQSELTGALLCTNEQLSNHFDSLRYSYRLISISYLLEGAWHLKLMSDHLGLKNGCHFNLESWLKSCRPRTEEMKKFLARLGKYLPRYNEELPSSYKIKDWYKDLNAKKFNWYSHDRIAAECKNNCNESKINVHFKNACESDQKLMTLICSEIDEVYGLSSSRDAYFLLARSNVINTFNQSGEAMGCLKRFSEVVSHKEVKYEVLKNIFPSIQTFLRNKYQERYLQGRVFFFGAGKEFEDKGLQDIYVLEQPFIPKKDIEPAASVISTNVEKKNEVIKPEKAKVTSVVKEAPQKKSIPEIRQPIKSAFLEAAETRLAENADRVEVDMLKLKYDYVFSLNMINSLSERLANFMTINALKEMSAYDKLGSKDGPVPLLFLKYMIDMQEHHGLWNIISVLGDKFWVSNEIDASFRPSDQLIQLVNNESTGRQWQIYILKP